MKRFFYSLLIIAAIALIIFIGYFFRYRSENGEIPSIGTLPGTPPVTGTPGAGGAGGGGELPGTPQPVFLPGQKFGLVVQNPVKDYFIESDNDIFLVQPDGQVVRVSSSGETSVLSSTAIANIISASFSPSGDRVLVSFGNLASPQFSVFDVQSKTWQPLDSKMQSPTWGPRGSEIAYFANRATRSGLETLDLQNAKAKPRELFRMYQQDLIPRWLNQNTVLLSEKSSALIGSSLWKYDVGRKSFITLETNKPGLQSAWNASGTLGLVFSAKQSSGRGGDLTLTDGSGKVLYRINFLTLPSKCLFTEKISAPPVATTSTAPAKQTPGKEVLYCAIHRDPEKLRTSELPDSYEKRELFTSDDFYVIDLGSGNTSPVFVDPDKDIDADNLKIFNNKLFFVNRFDTRLYAISLAE